MKVIYCVLAIAIVLSSMGCGRGYSPCEGVERPDVAIIERIFANYTQRTEDIVQDKYAPLYLDLAEPHPFSTLNLHVWASLYVDGSLIIDRRPQGSCLSKVASAYESYIDSIRVHVRSGPNDQLSGKEVTNQFVVVAHNLYPDPGFYSALPLGGWNALDVATEASATQELAVLRFVDDVSLPLGTYVLELEVHLDNGALFEIELPAVILGAY